MRRWLLLAAVIVVGGAAYFGWRSVQPKQLPDGFAGSNGRIEATEIDVAAKLAGRVEDVLVHEGDFVTAGQVLALMDTDVLKAQLREAEAQLNEDKSLVEAARSTVAQRESEKEAAESTVAQRSAQLDAARARIARVEKLIARSAASKEELDDTRAMFHTAEANLSGAKANVAAADAAIATAKSEVIRTEASVVAAQATIDRIRVDIDDGALKSRRDGRVQYRIAEPGEVLDAGGKALNMVDLSDVYMTFFLPTAEAGRVQMGAEARVVLDAAPQIVIPAQVTFVADVAQFTPKTVETATERQKLTFRIKAHIDPKLLKKYIRSVKTGLPGVAYVQLDPQSPWPAHLAVRLPE